MSYLTNIENTKVFTGQKTNNFQPQDSIKTSRYISALKIMRNVYLARGQFQNANIIRASIKKERKKKS